MRLDMLQMGMGTGIYYIGASQGEPAFLYRCAASDSAPDMQAVCARLFAPQSLAPAAP
jgi:hypothetical protein